MRTVPSLDSVFRLDIPVGIWCAHWEGSGAPLWLRIRAQKAQRKAVQSVMDPREEGTQFTLSLQPPCPSVDPLGPALQLPPPQIDSVLPSRPCHFFLEIALILGPDLCGPWRIQSEVPPPRVDRMKRLSGVPSSWLGWSQLSTSWKYKVLRGRQDARDVKDSHLGASREDTGKG